LGAEIADRQEKTIGVLQEGHQRPERQRAANDAPATEPHQQPDRDRAERLDRGIEGRLEDRRAEERLTIVGVERTEPIALVGFAREKLNDRHSLQRLLKESVEAGEALPDEAVSIAR